MRQKRRYTVQNKGFIFIETVIVLVVLATSLIGLYSSFSSVVNNIEKRKYYDNINDVYKVKIVKDLLVSYPSGTFEIIDKSNCTNYMNNDCSEVFNELNILDVLITGNNIQTIIDLDINIPNSMKVYLKTINKNEKSLIVHFDKNGENYYSSLELR